jgi:hypothetical protein
MVRMDNAAAVTTPTSHACLPAIPMAGNGPMMTGGTVDVCPMTVAGLYEALCNLLLASLHHLIHESGADGLLGN